MKWLFWKDYRENRLVVYAALFLLLSPHLVTLCAGCVQYFRGIQSPYMWIDIFSASTIFSLIISQLAVALIGGNAIAGERADRSAEFLASLPITRKRIVCSKLLLALAIVGVIWVTDASALLCLAGRSPLFWNDRYPVLAALATLGCVAIVALLLFSVAWLLSSFLSNPAYAVVGAIAVPSLLYIGIGLACFLFQVKEEYFRPIGISYFGICLALAPICFVAGTWYYLRRVEP